MIAASPESIRVSPQARSQNGTAEFTSPTTTSQPAAARSSASVRRGAEPAASAIAASSERAEPRRPRISVAGVELAGTAILMNMKDAPQIEREQREDDDRPAHLRSATQRRPAPVRFRPSAPARLNHLTKVADQPLHRALGLTDWEARPYPGAARARPEPLRARGLLAALVGALRLQALGAAAEAAALDGRARAPGAGRERGRPRPRRRQAVAFKVESHNHPSAVEPFQGAATGVGGILRDIDRHGRAADRAARRAALRRARLSLRARRRRDRRLRQLGRRADGRRRGRLRRGVRRTTASSTRCASGCCRPSACARRRRAAPGNVVVLYGATTGRDGIGGASVLASAGARRGRRRQAAVGPGRRPVHGQEADRGLARARRARPRRVAPGLRRRRAGVGAVGDGARRRGHRRPPRPRAAARGRHGAVGDHDLRVAGADGRGRRGRRCSTRCARCARAGSCPARRSAR